MKHNMDVSDILKQWLTKHDFDGLVKSPHPNDGDVCGCHRECLGDRCEGRLMCECYPGFCDHQFEDGEFWYNLKNRKAFEQYLKGAE